MRTYQVLLLIICLALTACQPGPSGTGDPTGVTPGATQDAAQETPQVVSTDTPVPSLTPTLEPGKAIMVLPENASGYYASLFDTWQAETAAQGIELIWTRQASLTAEDVSDPVKLIVVAPGVLAPDVLMGLAGGAPQAHFVVFDQPGMSAGTNISTVGPLRYDQQAFIAGYVAAVITNDWRVGALSPTDTPAGQAASAAFLNGAVFFCGLCNPYFGPIVDYPLSAGRPAAAGSAEWVAAAQELLDQAVTTVFLGPGVNDPAVLALLRENGVKVIGVQPVIAELADLWVFSVLPDDRLARELLPAILSGGQGQAVDFPVGLQNINPSLLSPGRKAHTEAMIKDLLSGLIDTGVDSSP